mmetsp:Transcript_17035/g.32238  ORF Transcript_17035/g.32238 Transcript_17035/m.32238 type:complete len:106 (-) Transcript_17035:1909-2226(-)
MYCCCTIHTVDLVQSNFSTEISETAKHQTSLLLLHNIITLYLSPRGALYSFSGIIQISFLQDYNKVPRQVSRHKSPLTDGTASSIFTEKKDSFACILSHWCEVLS